MTETSNGLLKSVQRGNWIRLRTMVLLRWWAIVGQIGALIVAQRLYSLSLDMGMCYLVVGISVIGNLVATFVYPETKRLSEFENLMMVLFDLVQLGLLLYLTGGLHNPFSILIVGPVIVSASALTSRSTLLLGVAAIIIATLLIEFHMPLRSEQGFMLRIPQVFVFGSWVAIVIAVIFLGVYSRWIVSEMHAMNDAVEATQLALSREQKLTDLGGVVAAAAHELGTPLATIKLTSAELAEELEDRPELYEDAMLIREQADRCRDILRDMGRAGKDDLHLRKAPLTALIEEAAEPHLDRGKLVLFENGPGVTLIEDQPEVLRRPEIIHGLRNLIQNAVDFARTTVWIESDWTENTITVRIMDDGRGYPPHLIGRIGDPFMRRRSSPPDSSRPGYEGMGLGLFIAKTLLERSGADLSFANGPESLGSDAQYAERTGAFIEVIWPRHVVALTEEQEHAALGENVPFSV